MKLECFDIQSTKEKQFDSGLSCQELQKIMFQKIRLHPIKLHLKIMLNLWSWRVWAMSLIMS